MIFLSVCSLFAAIAPKMPCFCAFFRGGVDGLNGEGERDRDRDCGRLWDLWGDWGCSRKRLLMGKGCRKGRD